MLAPMQGITNRALRRLFAETVRPDVVFTEFIRVRAGSKRGLSSTDRREVSVSSEGVPAVAQLIGADPRVLVSTAREIQDAGARHLNLNLGCPAGRMTPGAAGGGLLGSPERLPALLRGLRQASAGTFSVKVRAGYEDPRQILSLLSLFEGEGIDFLVLHPRTVKQGFHGEPDHGVTAEVVAATRLPVIANGDIVTAEQGRQVLTRTRSAGLMLGRGAVSDPLLFLRLRGEAADSSPPDVRRRELAAYLVALADRYEELFCGEAQVLSKLKEVFRYVREAELGGFVRELKRAQTLEELRAVLSDPK
jgi:tRNA-dihydrouridine synthase B